MDKEFLMNLEGMTEEMAEAILERHGKEAAGYEQRLKALATEGAVALAIATAGGRNQKAITALLDMQALFDARDLPAAAAQAVEALKKEHGYLFAAAPGYAPGTGAVQHGGGDEPMTLAEALKEKFYKC